MAGAIGAGSMFQANQAYSQFLDITGGADGPLAGRGWLFGLVITTLAGVVGGYAATLRNKFTHVITD